MRSILFILALAVAVPSLGSDRFPVHDWVNRATELGVESAYLELRYSLTDSCEISNVQVVENSNQDLFDAEAIREITRRLLGPFDTLTSKFVISGIEDDFSLKETIETRRLVSWRTDEGHQYIVCYLNNDGVVVRAEHTDGHRPPSKTAEDRPVTNPLSELDSCYQSIEFRVED